MGGGGQTSESIMSSVTRIMPTRSGGSVREELERERGRREREREISIHFIRFDFVSFRTSLTRSLPDDLFLCQWQKMRKNVHNLYGK